MRIFHINSHVQESDQLPLRLPDTGFVWISCTRTELEEHQNAVGNCLQVVCGTQLVDLHISDLLNPQLPSHYDYTAQYDVLVFRRLATRDPHAPPQAVEPGTRPIKHHGPPVLRRIDTSPVGFAVFDRVLLTVHPQDCAVRNAFADKLLQLNGESLRHSGAARLPVSSADLMLRLVNFMVDGYLDLRRELTRQLDHWQSELLNAKRRFHSWGALLDARITMHALDEICEDQRSAVQDWIDALETWPTPTNEHARHEHDLLKVRSRDVLEHIERVVHHVRRMEQSAETAVQIHFSLQGQRTNDIMRTLTVLTAIFLPLNFITGFFGMNFEFLPLIHSNTGLWWALSLMVMVAITLGVLFWRKRYLSNH